MKNKNKKYVTKFLKKYSVNNVLESIHGELNEYSCKEFTAYFGNGELLISPANETEDEIVYFADRIGFDYVLVEE